VITSRRTSPAKIFPNRRNVNEIIFENSDISSRIPTKLPIGSLNGFMKNLPPYPFSPSIEKPKIWHAMTEIAARANVMFTSANVDLNIGTNTSCPLWTSHSPMLPNPGSRPIQFETNTKKNIVATSGKNLRVFFSSPTIPTKKSNIPPINVSTRFWNPFGTSAYFLRFRISPITKNTSNVINAVMIVFLTSKLPMWNIVSDANVGGIKFAIIISF
jgi:hypothetical protein